MWNDQAQQIRAHLSSNERLLWSGQPRKGIIFRSSDIFAIPFSLLWGGFAIFWESAVIKSGAPFFFMLWGIPFVLVGLYMIVGRFIYDSWQRDKTYYGVTSERVLIIKRTLFSNNVTSLQLNLLPEISIDQKNDGSGTITFGEPNSMMLITGMGSRYKNRISPTFDFIQDANKVYEIIRNAQKQR